MGGAVNTVTNAVSGGIGGQVVGGILGFGAGGPVGGVLGSALGGSGFLSNPFEAMGKQAQSMVAALIPQIPAADQTKLQAAILQQQQAAQQQIAQGKLSQAQADAQLKNVFKSFGLSDQAINQAASTIQNTGQDALGILRGAAEGTAPSAAQAQLQAGKDQAIATQMAMANTGNLSQMIGGQKEAMMNAANITQQAANQAAQLRAQEMATARGQYGQQALGQIGAAQTQAGLAQQQAAQQAGVYGQQLGAAQGYAGMGAQGLGSVAAGQQGATELIQQPGIETARARGQALGGLMNAAGGGIAAAASDKNIKEDIKDTKPSKFFEALNAKSYKYKETDGKNGKTPGEHIGIIAQDVEKAPGGKSMIVELPEGKGIDIASAVGTLLAGAAETSERLNDLEEYFKAKKKRG